MFKSTLSDTRPRQLKCEVSRLMNAQGRFHCAKYTRSHIHANYKTTKLRYNNNNSDNNNTRTDESL